MENLSSETIERLNRFRQSDKFSSLKPETQARLNSFVGVSDENPLDDVIKETPSRFGRELMNPNPDVVSNVMAGGFAPTRAAVSAIQPIYDESKRQIVEALPGKTENWMLKGAEATGVDLLTGLAVPGGFEAAAKIPLKGLTLGERFMGLPLSKLFASKKGQLNKALDLSIKSRDEATRLFPQAQGSLEDVRNTGEATSKYVSKSKNYEDVANQLELAKGINAGEKQKLLDSGKIAYTTGQHDEMLSLINEAKTSPTANTMAGRRRLKALQEARDADLEFLNKQSPEDLNDPNFYQKLKEFHQGEAKKAGVYRENPNQSLKAEISDALARGYKKRAAAANELIDPINMEEKGLISAHEQARQLAKGEAMNMKPELGKEAVSSISGGPVITGARFVRKTMLDRLFGSPAKGITKKVSKLTKQSEKAQETADLIGGIESKRNPVNATLEWPKGLPAPPQRLLPGPEDFRTRDVKAGKLLQGSKTGKPISMEPSQIDLPETLESDLKILAEKWGVPERNVREIIKASDIKPNPRPSAEPIIMNKQRRKNVFDIMNRRKENF